jgi:hypothetical protein
MYASVYLAFGAIGLLGLVGFLYGWFSIQRETRQQSPDQSA